MADKNDSTIYRYVHENGKLYRLETLFKKKHVSALERCIGKDGMTEFHIWSYGNSRSNDAAGWQLHAASEIIKAIALAKKHKVNLIGGSR